MLTSDVPFVISLVKLFIFSILKYLSILIFFILLFDDDKKGADIKRLISTLNN